MGTCLSATECTSRGGSADGNCASGFGVCCTFTKSTCGSTVSQNCTYVQNPGYSSSYTVTTTTSCSYSVAPISSDICQIRLDFDKFVIGIGTTGTCSDSFKVTGPTNTNALSVLCGTLTGQHLYVENGRSTSSSTLAFTIASTTGVTWNMKVSQIECGATYKAPSDCAQYITGASGFIQSYNWQGADQITGNDFTFCIRKEKGYCSIAYFPAITSSTIDNFRLDDISTSILGGQADGVEGLLVIAGSQSPSSHISGQVFSYGTAGTIDSQVLSYGPRFLLTHVVDADNQDAASTGFNLQYNQIPCEN